MNYSETARARHSSDAGLAQRLRQVEALFDLHSAGMNITAAELILQRIVRVRKTLEERAARYQRTRLQIALVRHNKAVR